METVETAKYRIRRSFFDHRTGRVYDRLSEIPGRLTLLPAAVRCLLRIGYVPGHATLFEGVDCLPGGAVVRVDRASWHVVRRYRAPGPGSGERDWSAALAEGAEVFCRAVRRCLERDPNPIVPLSGGMDSRAILAAVLEEVPAWKVRTYSHGVVGANDFELGNLVARRAGTTHVALDLEQVPFSAEGLAEIADWSDANTDLVQPVVWRHIAKVLGPDGIHWTGFTGDGLGGSFSQRWPSMSVEAAVETYYRGEMGRMVLIPAEEPISSELALVEREGCFDGALSPVEAVWFTNHVERYTAHHLFMNRLRYENPFMDDEFVEFMVGLPTEWRLGKRFFDEMMTRRFPRLFDLPLKDAGWSRSRQRWQQPQWVLDQSVRKALWRLAPAKVHHPMLSYLDFGEALRSRRDLRSVAEDHLHTLARRDVVAGKRLLAMWQDHRTGRADHRYVLTQAVSLEAIIRRFCD